MKYKPSFNSDTNSLHILCYMAKNQYETADEKRCSKSTTIYREETTSVCFHVAPLCWSNWDLECWFFRSEENRSSQEKPSEQDENQQTYIWHMAEIEPGRTDGRRALSTTAPSLLCQLTLLSRNWFGLSRNDNISSNWCGTVSRRRAERNYLIELAKFLNKVIIR